MIDAYMKVVDQCFFEVKEAFDGLADEHVWKRPAENLLSVGELAGHMAFWEAVKFAGEGTDLEKCRIRSPLIDPRFRYYQSTLESAPSEEHLAMSAQEVLKELLRVHEEAMANFKALDPDLKASAPGWPAWGTYEHFIQYLPFHVAYHTGQIYSARHLLGEQTPDN